MKSLTLALMYRARRTQRAHIWHCLQVEATKYTELGYIGRDVVSLLSIFLSFPFSLLLPSLFFSFLLFSLLLSDYTQMSMQEDIIKDLVESAHVSGWDEKIVLH